MSWKRLRPWFRKTKERTLNWPGRFRPALFSVIALAMIIVSGCTSVSQTTEPIQNGSEENHLGQSNPDGLLSDNTDVTASTPPEAPNSSGTIVNPDATTDQTSLVDALRGTPSSNSLSRPIMVMVENSPAARPQTGLEKADVIYEILAEGEITRFAAIFHSKKPGTIGPVRSIRPYYVQIGAAIDAVIVHAGWSQDGMNAIKKYKADHFDQVYGDEAYYWRDKSRKMPHNLYTGIDRILKGIEAKKKRTDWTAKGFLFDPSGNALQIGEAATEVHIPYLYGYHVDYAWNEKVARYVRSMNNKPHYDAETGNDLMAANLLICKSKHKVLDEKFRRDVDVIGPGKGWLAQNGRIIPITWKMSAGLVRAFDASGTELHMNPGQTWIQFVQPEFKVAWK